LPPDDGPVDFSLPHAREATLAERKVWFFVMTPEIANRPGSQWARSGAASPESYVFRPVSPEGWFALLAFAALAIGVMAGIWMGLVLPGHVSVAMAIVFTVMVEAIVVGCFVLLVQLRMTPRPAARKPVTDGMDQTFQTLW
jgi:hypothetical protein